MPTSTHPMRVRQRGAALAVGLILLVVLTLLAFTGINAATTELAMAGNEQYRKNAAQASGAGIEVAIARVGTVNTVPGTQVRRTEQFRSGTTAEEYEMVTTFVGDENGIPQSSMDKFVGLHYEIVSNGSALRNTARRALDGQTQGVFVVSPQRAGESNSYRRIGTGLAP
jgi:type IV pilus assembly protein PilX